MRINDVAAKTGRMVFNPFRFNDPQNYWQALTEQSQCLKVPSVMSFPAFFRIKNALNATQILSNPIFEAINPRVKTELSENIKVYYSNSVLETMAHLFGVGALFRTFEIIGYRAKNEVLKQAAKKYHTAIHIGFEVCFLATTALACELLVVSFKDYMQAKAAEYVFRGAGYALQSKYSFMDYAAEVNLVALKNKDTLIDFAILKSAMFAKNYIATAVIMASHFMVMPPNLTAQYFINGFFLLIIKQAEYDSLHFKCTNNGYLLYKYPNFINFMQELGLFSGALAVDAALIGLKKVGVVKDVNTGAIDPDYRRNLIMSAIAAKNNTTTAIKHVYEAVIRPFNPNTIPEVVILDNRIIKNKKGPSARVGDEAINKSGPVVKLTDAQLPELPKHAVALDGYSGVVFAINACKANEAKEFNTILADKGSRSPFNLLTTKGKNGDKVYELQHPGRDHRLLGPMLNSTSAMARVAELANKEFAAEVRHKFDAYAKVLEKNDWQCVVLTTYVSKHSQINQLAMAIA